MPHRSISYRHKSDQVELWDQQGQLLEEHHLVSSGFHLCLVQGAEEGLFRLFSDSKRTDQVELWDQQGQLIEEHHLVSAGFHLCLVQGEEEGLFRLFSGLKRTDQVELVSSGFHPCLV